MPQTPDFDAIKHLRQLTGNSIALCKKALEETGGDIECALTVLHKSAEALAVKKSEKTTGAGVIESYVHSNKKVGVLLELRCETDFVARNEVFQALAHDIALHIAGMHPLYISESHIPLEARQEARQLFMQEAESFGKTKELTDKIVQGKLDAFFKESSLLQQPFVKNPSFSVEELIKRAIGHFGEKIEVTRFTYYTL